MKFKYLSLAASVAFAALLLRPSPALAAASAPPLGSAETFAVLGGTTVTNTGATIITGDLGVSPGTALTGFAAVDGGLGVVNGTIHAGDAVAAQAHNDAMTAYNALLNQPCDFTYGTVEPLGGKTLTPGVHCFPSSADLAAGETLTLDFQGNDNAVFVFKIGSTLVAKTGSIVDVIGRGPTCNGSNVFWAVGSSATIGTDTTFVGNILAFTSIGLQARASVDGRALAIGGAVTMDTNNVTACGSSGGGTFPQECTIKVTGGGQIPVPDPNDADPDASGTGRATFGFNAMSDESGDREKGRFNYLNHVTGLHVEGPVTDVEVIATNPDGSPKTVRLSGTCKYRRGEPKCSFSVTVEDHGEPGTSDQLGIAVTGAPQSELRSQRVIRRGNIQFHKSHCRCDPEGKDRRPGYRDDDGTCPDPDGGKKDPHDR